MIPHHHAPDKAAVELTEERILDEAKYRAQNVYQRAGIKVTPRWPLLRQKLYLVIYWIRATEES